MRSFRAGSEALVRLRVDRSGEVAILRETREIDLERKNTIGFAVVRLC